MAVLNGEPFIRGAIEQFTDFAEEIFVMEGAVEGLRLEYYTNKGSSIDLTTDTVQDMGGRYSEVKVFMPNVYNSISEMYNQMISLCKGDYIWITAYDEFYFREDIKNTIKLLKTMERTVNGCDVFCFNVLNFFKGKDYIMTSGGSEWYEKLTLGVPRIFKKGNIKFKDFERMDFSENKKARSKFYFNHFSYIYPLQVQMKIDLYQHYLKWGTYRVMQDWFDNFFMKWTEENREQLEKSNKYGAWPLDKRTRTEKYNGPLEFIPII
jgi:hypothetical protein